VERSRAPDQALDRFVSVAAAPSASRRGAITLCVMLATIMQTIDTTIANISLPYMQGSLSATLDQINWVLTSYIVAAAIMTPPTGWLAGRLGRKRFFLISIAGFTTVSMLCGMAQSLEQMVLFRLLQGVFGAPLVPLSQAVLLDSYPREKHGQAMAIWGLGVMVGPILGPTMGAYLTEFYNWRWVFYINLPVGIIAFLGLSASLTEARAADLRPLDWFGFGALSLSVGALQLMLDRGEQLDWFSSPEIMVELALALLGFYLFIVHSLTTERPFLDRRLFRDPNYAVSLVFTFLVGIVLLATIALLTPFLQYLVGLPITTAGLVLGPRGLGTMAAMMVIGRLVNQVDVRFLLFAGFALVAASLWQMTGFTADVDLMTIVATGALQGVGLGLIWVPLSTVAFSTLAPDLRTQGTALVSLVRNLGSSTGISIVIYLLGRNTRISHAELTERVTSFSPAVRDLATSSLWTLTTPTGRAALDLEILRQATTISYINDFKLLMIVALVALPLLLFLRPMRTGHVEPDRVAAD
jgi:DHA2 family multidrug resistance protein